ncbi:hypothetical protein SASPL_125170 [Salvia splendens]|uniref:Uncharacterized protein n=1 Tax=Salvia splendens TaxID=180675 RepID=A0A8X8XEU0_SALSN|nr:hypothetical protein SASPL_125170 [Salvia splendens]
MPSHTLLNNLLKSLIISGLLIHLISISSFNNNNSLLYTSISLTKPSSSDHPLPPCNATHIVFGIAATASTWSHRKHSVESWWRPNLTRGYVFLDKIKPELLPWPNHTLPPFHVSQDTSRYKDHDKHLARDAIRMARIRGRRVVTRYGRARPRGLPACSVTGNHSAEFVADVVVSSPAAKFDVIGNRRECCDVLNVQGGNATEIKFRDCRQNEIIP